MAKQLLFCPFFTNFAGLHEKTSKTYDMALELSEQEQLRRQSLTALRELGIEPYPAARYEVTATAREIADNYDDTEKNFQEVRIAGRIMSRRIMGSASFFELQDHTGRIQVYIRRDDVCPEGDIASALGLDFEDLLNDLDAIVYSGTKLNIASKIGRAHV